VTSPPRSISNTYGPVGRQKVLGVAAPAQRDDGGMLEEQQDVVREAARDPILREPALPREGRPVGHPAGLDHFERASAHGVASGS